MWWRDWAWDSCKTILSLPVHLVICVYGCFDCMFTQLKYDFLNNRKNNPPGWTDKYTEGQ